MDNRIFDINGYSKEDLLSTLKLAIKDDHLMVGYKITDKHGFILYQYHSKEDKDYAPFPVKINALIACELVWEWLKTNPAVNYELSKWDKDIDVDGHTDRGWRVYCEDWGHINNVSEAYLAVRPVYLWYGK